MKLPIANWKLNPTTLKEAIKLARETDKNGAVICPPFIFLLDVKKVLKRASLGAQDVFWEEEGPYTGEVSPAMLKSFGVKYVIIGHSERRRWLNETDEMVNKKVKAALEAGLKVILCVGEQLAVRKRGLSVAKNFVKSQLQKGLKGVREIKNWKLSAGGGSAFGGKTRNLIIAYEPIWAIGTGRADKPKDTAEMAKFIKNLLRSKFYILNSMVLYGGSVNSQNAANFLKLKEIDGALVGGASLRPNEFNEIIKLAK